jgi:S-formylglutathione hydrolase FrmB
MKYKFKIVLFLSLILLASGFSQDSINLKFFSPKTSFDQLDKKTDDNATIINKLFVYTPKEYAKGIEKYPLVYLFHGWAGSSYDWKINYDVQKLADKYKMIIVLPDGYYDSWYLNSVNQNDLQYESAFWKRLVPFVEKIYRVDTKNIFITGLSMGGHGAITFYLKYRDHFKAAGSMSGILDITQFASKWGISKKLGDFKKNKSLWEKYSAINLLSSYIGDKKKLNIYVTCGKKDFASKVNAAFAKKAKSLNVQILSTSDAGTHNWEYWTSHVDNQILYFSLLSKNKDLKDIKKIMKIK